MDPPLHGKDILSSQLAEDKVTLVPNRCADRKSRNVPVRDDDLVLNLVHKFSKPAAEDDAYLWDTPAKMRSYGIGSLVDSFFNGIHSVQNYVVRRFLQK